MSSSTAVQPNSFTACLLSEMSHLPYGSLNVLVMEGSLNSPVKRRRESRYVYLPAPTSSCVRSHAYRCGHVFGNPAIMALRIHASYAEFQTGERRRCRHDTQKAIWRARACC